MDDSKLSPRTTRLTSNHRQYEPIESLAGRQGPRGMPKRMDSAIAMHETSKDPKIREDF
jgi:hypothetical protein